MRIILFFSFFFLLNTAGAQECFPEKRKDKKLVNRVEKLIVKRDYYAVFDQLSGENEFAVFFALKSEVFWRKGDYFKAETEALKAIEICPDNFPRAYYFLGEISYNRKDFVFADKYLRKAIDLEIGDPYYSDAIMLYEKAKILAEIINNPVEFNPKIVKGISTEFDEYLPIISPDQELSFFTRRLEKKSKNSISSSVVEEFTWSSRNGKYFTSGSPLEYPFNRESNEGGATITIDNKILYFTKCQLNKSGYKNCDIFYVFNQNGEWSEVQTFPDFISKYDSWESQPTISSNGQKIIFASDRKGGYGKIDLYETTFKNGEWSNPENLGDKINSNENEKSPYLHTDGKTLFFASTNFPSLGGFDIFYSRKDSLGNWGKPQNIGYPINSVADEISLFVSTDGNSAYFASNHLNGVGGWDIYSFDLHKEARPERVLFLKGDLLDENGQVLNDVELEIKNIKTNEITTIKVDAGTYVSSLTLDEKDDVLITVKKEGFAFNSTYISANDTVFKSPSSLDISMQSLDAGKSFTIEDIYFDNNSYELKEITKEVLVEFAKYLEINNSLIIEINGFTDNIGDTSDNQILSENRSKAVRDLILLQGISESRISYKGFGESSPKSDNNTEKGRAQNRRTEFRIIRK
jgi:outer membrane protein OmpA-like peptidoglycan-associated protein/tetratricopeptide (TPR) repeat protein